MKGRGWLADLLAVPAGDLLPHSLHHLPLAGNDLQRPVDVLADLAKTRGAAACAASRGFDDNAPARQVLRKGLAAGGPATGEGFDRDAGVPIAASLFRRDGVFGRRRFQLFKLKLHLIQQTRGPFRPVAVDLPAELRDLQLQVLDHSVGAGRRRFGARQLGLNPRCARFGSGERGAQISDLSGHIQHGRNLLQRDVRRHRECGKWQENLSNYPALAGRCVQRGLRQSIPSRR